MEGQFVVISDVHARAEQYKDVIDHYGDTVRYVPNGDVLDGTDQCRQLLDMFQDYDTDMVLGNHEWVGLAAMTDIDPERRAVWQDVWWRGYQNGTLDSYGVKGYTRVAEAAEALRDRMEALGHLSLLRSARVFFEDADIFIVHAGMDPSMEMARIYQRLDAAQAMHESRAYHNEPVELFSGPFAKDYRRPRDLNKLLITGHIHFTRSAEARLYSGHSVKPTRLFLASHLDAGEPLFVYENWSGEVRAFP